MQTLKKHEQMQMLKKYEQMQMLKKYEHVVRCRLSKCSHTPPSPPKLRVYLPFSGSSPLLNLVFNLMCIGV